VWIHYHHMWVGSWDAAGVPGQSFCWFIQPLAHTFSNKEKEKNPS